ncbi:MAG TPA: hypothetical protein VFK46_02485, partial [Candidatus Macondimonas sp.]|nr:hypothetical protein [Candidatus Macondimonas sp.]
MGSGREQGLGFIRNCPQPLHERRRQIPEQAHHRHAKRDTGRDLRLQQLRIGRRQDEIDAEAMHAALAQRLHLRVNQFDRLAHHAQETEAPARVTMAISSARATPPMPASTRGYLQ